MFNGFLQKGVVGKPCSQLALAFGSVVWTVCGLGLRGLTLNQGLVLRGGCFSGIHMMSESCIAATKGEVLCSLDYRGQGLRSHIIPQNGLGVVPPPILRAQFR